MASVLILGATSTIARAVAGEFAARGYDLILAGRNPAELKAEASDLALRYQVKTSVQLFEALNFNPQASLDPCLAEAGDELEGAVLCIGYLGDQTAAQSDFREARRILDTNFAGCVLALEAVAAHLEKRGRGFICAVSSVAGDRGRQSNYLYGAAKAGLTAYLSGLRNRLYHAGVRVITVKPGFVATRMTFGRAPKLLAAKPETVARGIYRAVARGKDVVYLPGYWRWVMLVIRLAPEGIFKRLRL